MYCVKCGVKLADTEKKCPLCGTAVCHPDFEPAQAQPLYPSGRLPRRSSRSRALNGAVTLLFLLPALICCYADLSPDGRADWFGYVAGALAVSYVAFALPFWFRKPNPVIFTPCGFAAAALYLLYINCVTEGDWFLRFALPVVGGLCLITCAVVTLLYYLRRGRLYILGGALMALGGMLLLTEFLLTATFGLAFTGWSVYPLIVLALLGAFLIYCAINEAVCQTMERKLFF